MPEKDTIILTTFACHPQMGSEPGHGWGLLLTAAKLAEKRNLNCICLTLPRYIQVISDELALLNLLHRVQLVAVQIPTAVDVPKNGLLLRIGYVFYCLRANQIIRGYDENRIRVIHHSNYASEVLPNPIPRKMFRNALRIIGPIGSSQNLRVSRILIRDSKDVLIFVMDTAKFVASRILFRTFVDSGMKVIFNSELIKRNILGKKNSRQTQSIKRQEVCPSLFLENSPKTKNRKTEHEANHKVAIISVLNRRKKVDFALEALNFIDLKNLHCDIYGDGPEKERLQKLSARLKIDSKITWKGTVDRAELRGLLPTYDAILHPSVREGASTITGEAIVAGIPIVVFDGTGAAGTLEYVGLTDSVVSTRVVKNKKELVEAFSDVLLSVLGMKWESGNPFGAEHVGHEMMKWYEIVE